MKAKEFKDLLVWQKAKNLVLDIYKITNQFPSHEMYTLTNQFRRAGISIIANIAEEFTRNSAKEKLKFYNIAMGSIQECRCFSILSSELKYADMKEKENGGCFTNCVNSVTLNYRHKNGNTRRL